ncbi:MULTISPECIES: bile acid:sodium symporter family protein [unclassified Acinetobacter]|uniref:bile acid:sodium symporter family protein n=1 Tax=unclassified Acinetobacter TaxID=196816 RepID=UPI00244D60ED|nr:MULTISPECIES: bile acid:sodium symporter family protein [unclassified Acinetobacter]MDH0030345.1 bile acid:sodium symporter family protein [Acinetobacter sp. GD04021]MDH0885913.1 bile acid:sodium symporter family protein [Acinetobacter sp. GD03873]MDH1082533.1 bile acid:sodium symporter family protein [Acinetobacter sp. GD03983]MDH2189075.1 bile acid:sodium symporter family protein [Acinetobacter sp. GD03645]MDH2202263.1 bile acid:sodium symporter family protein [Acinetobacter sp. GD03647]
MDSGLITLFLPIALAIVMVGMGLELTLKDFARVSKHPKAVLIALFCQLILLVGIAFLICKILALPPLLAVGLMLLAASPGGTTANLFSYLYKGDIALNITLTAINAIIAAVFLPFIVNFAILHFMNEGQHVGLQFSKVLQVFLIILVPVAIGMLIRHYAPHLAEKLNRPVRIFAVVFLLIIILGAIFKERSNLVEYIGQIGLATALFCAISLLIGYFVPRIMGINSYQARACAFEIGIHNSTLAMTIALTIMASTTIAIPAAVYSIFMYIFATIFGMMITKFGSKESLAS